VTAGGATIGGIVTLSNGLVITAGGLSVAAGGATIASSGTNTLSTTATGAPALTVSAQTTSGFTSSVLSVSTGMAADALYYLIKVRSCACVCGRV
jgi:hypothetical protein